MKSSNRLGGDKGKTPYQYYLECKSCNNVSLTEILENLTPGEQADLCQAITDAGCDFSSNIDIVEILNTLSPEGQTALCQAIIDAGCDLTQLIDFCSLDAAQITCLTQVIDPNQLTTQQLNDLWSALCGTNPTLFNAHAGGDGTIAGSTTGPIPVTCGDDFLIWSSDGSVLVNVTQGSVIYDLKINPTVLAGITHTAITNIDLKPTGVNANEFTVEITWTDEDGNTNVTTDPTPITIDTPAKPYKFECYTNASGEEIVVTTCTDGSVSAFNESTNAEEDITTGIPQDTLSGNPITLNNANGILFPGLTIVSNR